MATKTKTSKKTKKPVKRTSKKVATISPEKKLDKVLDLIAGGMFMNLACEKVGITRQAIYKAMRQQDRLDELEAIKQQGRESTAEKYFNIDDLLIQQFDEVVRAGQLEKHPILEKAVSKRLSMRVKMFENMTNRLNVNINNAQQTTTQDYKEAERIIKNIKDIEKKYE